MLKNEMQVVTSYFVITMLSLHLPMNSTSTTSHELLSQFSTSCMDADDMKWVRSYIKLKYRPIVEMFY